MIFFKKKLKELNTVIAGLQEKIFFLERESRKDQAILNSMIEGVVVLAADTRITSLNPTVEKIFGIDAQEATGKLFLEAIRNNELNELVSDVLEKKEFISKEISTVWPLKKHFEINASPILEDKEIRGCLLVIHDITEIRKLETMRRDFVANVSHELKTPLTSIKGFIETLLEGALDDKENSRHFLEIIRDHANRLDSLTQDLLILSSAESKEAQLDLSSIDLKELADKVLLGFKAQLKKKDISIRNEIPAGLTVQADSDKIEQVLTNLIDNAIKFNREKGWVRIYSEETHSKIKVGVEDSGFGIPEKDLPRIFERFYRVDKARSRELGGTGLGLSIVKHIVELHGGSVGLESTEGLGSNFFFSLQKHD
ncbi:MAG: ATP-binding protein [Candidatus Omnitrophica bacterium]|nr:ATP-binding protein [Candidatus Omnitrophota bacterium]MDD5653317.1 ATP-binding protein [Candidatus Omnitrophota bacterium]